MVAEVVIFWLQLVGAPVVRCFAWTCRYVGSGEPTALCQPLPGLYYRLGDIMVHHINLHVRYEIAPQRGELVVFVDKQQHCHHGSN